MSKGKRKLYGYGEEYFTTVASIMAHSVVVMNFPLNPYEKFYQAHIGELYVDSQKILAESPAAILELPDRNQPIGVKIAAIFYHAIMTEDKNSSYMLSLINSILNSEEMMHIAAAPRFVLDCYLDAKGDSVTSVNELISNIEIKARNTLPDLAFLYPFLFDEKHMKMMCENWNIVFPIYNFAIHSILLFHGDWKDAVIEPDDVYKAFEKAKIAGKSKSISDYSSFWYENVSKVRWDSFNEKSARKAIVSPMLLFSLIADTNGLGIPDSIRNGFVTKADTVKLMGIVKGSIYVAEQPPKKAALRKDTGKPKKSSISIDILDDVDLDVNFFYALLLDKLTKELVTHKKERLKQLIDGEAKNAKSDKAKQEIIKRMNDLEKQKQQLESEKKSISEENSALFAKYSSLQNKVSSLQNKIALLQDDIQRMAESDNTDTSVIVQKELADLVKDADSMVSEATPPAPVMTAEECRRAICCYESEKRIIIVGGNTNLIKKFCQFHPEISFVGNKNIGTCDQLIQSADIVLFKTDSMEHTLYRKCKQLAKNRNIPIEYIPETASITYMEKAVLEDLKKHFEEA